MGPCDTPLGILYMVMCPVFVRHWNVHYLPQYQTQPLPMNYAVLVVCNLCAEEGFPVHDSRGGPTHCPCPHVTEWWATQLSAACVVTGVFLEPIHESLSAVVGVSVVPHSLANGIDSTST